MSETTTMGSTQAALNGDAAALTGRVLCVDDEPNILSALKRVFRTVGIRVETAGSGLAGLSALEQQRFDVVISDMRMPEMDGTQFLEQVRRRWPESVRMLLTGYSEVSSIIGAVNRGEIYRYIAKPWDDNDIILIVRQALERKHLAAEKQRLEQLTAEQNAQLRELNATLEQRVAERTEELRVANERLKASFVTSIKMFSTLLEARGGVLAGHSRRVADLCRKIAQHLGLPSAATQDVFLAALVHEVGKVSFTDEMLRTPLAQMSPDQQEQYRRHTEQAEQLLMPLPELRNAIDIILAQFERFDGSGHPKHLAGETIPLGARILAVASDYDAMLIGTLVQRKLQAADARTLIQHGSGRRYDPRVVEALGVALNPSPSAAKAAQREIEIADASQLKPGMVLVRDLVAPSGLLMLAADHKLDAQLIQRIRDYERLGGVSLKTYVYGT